MDALFLQLYCMRISDVLLLGLFGTLLLYLLKQLWGNSPVWKPLMAMLLLAWAAAVAAQTVMGRDSDGGDLILMPLHSYREAIWGGRRELLRSNFMNAFLFYPPGLIGWELLPARMRPKYKMLILLLAALTMSLTIESLQYLGNLGLAETDDVIHNTLGTALAAILCRIRSGGNKSP